jgi:anti-sigma factor (TIGR02949 family)
MSMFNRLKKFFSSSAGSAPAMISCEDALQLVHEFIDGELEAVSTEQVKQHFDMCQRCYPHLQLESAFREALQRAARGTEAPADLRSKLTAMIAEERGDE